MSALTAAVFAWAFSPVLAPVPPEPPPDPLAKGYLGIRFGGSGPNSSLMIDSVEPNQPAAKAGLRGGDVLVRVNHLHAQAVDQVIDHVCAFRPGAVIEVEVRRGSERKTFKIKLASRPPDLNRGRALPVPVFPEP
jgi:S1-C subfamily serine protease